MTSRNASARVAVDNRGAGDGEAVPADADNGDHRRRPRQEKPERASVLFKSVVDAVVSDHDEPIDEEKEEQVSKAPNKEERALPASDESAPRRRGHRLSMEEQLKIRKTSLILTNPQVHELVLTHCERTRVQRLKDKLFHHPHSFHHAMQTTTPAATTGNHRIGGSSNGVRALDQIARMRHWLRVHIKSKPFRFLLYSVILSDLVALTLDEGTGDETTPYLGVDVVCTLLLFVEILVKSIAFGWFAGRDAYFTRSKRVVRVLNVAMLALSLLSYAFGYKWRILRGLKTFRCLTLYAGLRRILRSLGRAIPFLANVGTLALFFLFAFSIFGLEAYQGAYDMQCRWDLPEAANNDTFWEALPRAYCSTNASCLAPMRCDTTPPPSAHVNFDSGLSSLFLVFLVVAQDGWVTDIMEPVVEATSRFSALFFVAIVASMVFLVVNLFVAVITTSFMNFSAESAREKDEDTAVADGDADDSASAGGGGMRSSMIKMDPLAEATRVSLIMGATLAIEESFQQKLPQDDTAETTNAALGRNSTFAKILARTHRFQSLHDLTAEATRELIQNASSVDEFLLTRTNAAGGGVGKIGVTVIPEEDHQHDETVVDGRDDLYADEPAASAGSLATSRTTALIRVSVSAISSFTRSISPRRVTKLADQHAPFSSLSDVIHATTTATHPWFSAFQRVVLSKRFDDFITACIVVNTAFLLIEFRDMSAWVRAMLSVTEYLFATVFFGEMVARITAMRGLRRYLHSTERCFDMVVVLCTSVNIVLNNVPSANFSGLNSVSSLRTLRVSRLMMKWEGTRKLIESVLKSSRGVMDVVVFLILFQVVSSIVAMQLFGGAHMASGGDTPRWNFDSFPRSFLTLLQVITADQWSSITYDAVNADDPHVLLVPFLIVNFIIGQYVLLNLFIAVILENFSISEEEAYQLQLEQIIAIPKELDIYEKIEEEGVRAFGEMEQLDNVSNVKLRMFLGLDADAAADDVGGGDYSSGGAHATLSSGTSMSHGRKVRLKPATRGLDGFGGRAIAMGKRSCRRVTRSRTFHRLVQLMILVSCVTLMLDDPHPEIHVEPANEDLVLALSVCNRVALGVFLVEFLAKVGAHGFGVEYLQMLAFHRDDQLGYVKKQAYIEDRWNQLDFFLLVLTVADEVITHFSGSLSAARMFRAGRVLRPLRILNHNHEMKLILSAVAQSLPHVGNVFGLCAIVYVIFGVVGRSLFSGLFFSCNDAAVATMDECVGFFTVEPDGALALQEATARSVPNGAILVPRVWSNARFSFDNIGAAFLTLLEMTSLKWIDKTFAAMDITGANLQPAQDHAPLHALFFILFVYIGSLFVIRLFVGVLVEQFQRNNGTQILTESQKSWVDLEKFVLLLKPLTRIPRPRMALQSRLFDLCQHRYFGRCIAVAILLNVALLLFNPSNSATSSSSSSVSSPSTESQSFQVIELLFLAVFTTEAALKCLAFRHYYILTAGGAFELIILGGSLVAYFLATGIHGLIQAGRVFRMMRVLRFVRLNRGVYAVFQTFRASLKPIGHIFFLLFMIFFIFAIVGRQLFGGVRLGPSMNRFSNFRSFSSSFLLLFQIMAGDDWHLTMTDCMQTKPFCVERTDANGKLESDCGSPAGAVLFFVTYVTLVVFFLLNLFIAVVLENFRSCYLQGDVCPISLQDFETYKEVFVKYDVDGNGSFPLWQLANFLDELPPGLRVDRRQQRTAFLQIRSQAQALQESWQQNRCKRPFFNELLRMLCIHQLGIRCLPYEQQRDRVKQIFIYRAKVADMLVESAVKGFVQRWRIRKERAKMEAMRRKMVPEAALTRTSVRRRSSTGSMRGEEAALVTTVSATVTEGGGGGLQLPFERSATSPVGGADDDGDTGSIRTAVAMSLVSETVAAVMAQVRGPVEATASLGVGANGDHEQVGATGKYSDTAEEESLHRKQQQHHKHHHRHHHHHHKHKKHKKHKDKKSQAVAPRRDSDDDETVGGRTGETEPTTVPKSSARELDEPLHAPRRLPKLTNKIVPT